MKDPTWLHSEVSCLNLSARSSAVADSTAAFVHITTLIRQSIVCEKYQSVSHCVCVWLVCMCVTRILRVAAECCHRQARLVSLFHFRPAEWTAGCRPDGKHTQAHTALYFYTCEDSHWRNPVLCWLEPLKSLRGTFNWLWSSLNLILMPHIMKW